MSSFSQLSTTTDNEEEALNLARLLVGQRLAACVQVLGPVKSVYRWEGEIEQAEEWVCLIKTREDLFEETKDLIEANHSYEVPECLSTPIIDGSEAYLQWLDNNLAE